MRTSWSALVAAMVLGAPSLAAQTVRVEVAEAGSARPLQGVLVTLDDAAGAQVARDLTDPRGLATLAAPTPGDYALRAELIGYTTEVRTVAVASGAPTRVALTLETGAIEIEGLEVEAEGRCEVRPEGDLTVGQVWSEIRKALEAAQLTQERNTYQYRTRNYTRTIEEETGRVADQSARFGSAYQTTPFVSRPVEELLAEGFVQDDDDRPGGGMYYAPDALVLVSDPFLDTHCMRLTWGDDETAGLIGVAFEPVENRRVADISGTLWVDPETWLLSHLEYAYVHTRPDVETHGIGGEVAFQRLPDGTWIVPEWRIRTPWLALGRDTRGRESIYQFGYHDIGATVVSVREPGGDVLFTANTAALEGVVVAEDSGDPVAGVVVALPGFDQPAVTDAEGRFRITEVPEGDYVVTATAVGAAPDAPPLASAAVELRGGGAASVRLVAADATADALAACREEYGSPALGTAVVTGRVTAAADGRPLNGARVTIEWDDLSRLRERGVPDRATLTATTGVDGSYRACGVPTEVPLEVQVEWGDVRTNPEALRLDLVRSAVHDLVVEVGSGERDAPGSPDYELEGFDVAVEARRIRLQAAGFYERRREDLGVYLTAEEIEPQLPTTIPNSWSGGRESSLRPRPPRPVPARWSW